MDKVTYGQPRHRDRHGFDSRQVCLSLLNMCVFQHFIYQLILYCLLHCLLLWLINYFSSVPLFRTPGIQNQGGHEPGKHGKPGRLREFEKLSKSQGNLNLCRKTWKTQGKWKVCNIIATENVFHRIFLSWVAQGKIWEYPGNLRENSGNLVSQKCGHPEIGVRF